LILYQNKYNTKCTYAVKVQLKLGNIFDLSVLFGALNATSLYSHPSIHPYPWREVLLSSLCARLYAAFVVAVRCCCCKVLCTLWGSVLQSPNVPMFRGLLGSGFLCCGPANAGNFCISVSPFFCTFVCFCFSFKLNANKFAFFVPRPARHFYAHHPGSNCSKCGVVGEKVSFALGTRAFDLVYFHFISFRLVWFSGVEKFFNSRTHTKCPSFTVANKCC